jgi:hypothetical protein
MRQRNPRKHDEAHLAFIRQLPCAVCLDNTATEAAHVRYPEPKAAKPITGAGTKPDDKFVVPLCSKCHREQHGGKERAFWNGREIDPIFLALALYSVSGDYDRGLTIIGAYH